MAGSLTVANSVIAMTTEALFPQAQRLQGYATDDAFDFESVENAEFGMGIDGKLSAGFVFNEIPLGITLQADSASLSLFEQIYQYEVTNRTKLQQQLTITLPAVSKRYDLTGGFMRRYKAPSGKKILQPGVVEFVFARLAVSAL